MEYRSQPGIPLRGNSPRVRSRGRNATSTYDNSHGYVTKETLIFGAMLILGRIPIIQS